MKPPKGASLRIALPKGRMSEESIAYLHSRKLSSFSEFPSNRKLIFNDPEKNIEYVLVRSKDVATYVEHGSCDFGIIGYDLLVEGQYDVFIPAELPFGKCSLCTAYSEQHKDWQSKKNIRVATKYPKLASKYFFDQGFNFQIIELYGSIEIAPLTGIADVIVDLVSTGQTLQENNLVQGPKIMESSARLILNPGSYFLKRDLVQSFLNKLSIE
ncbi:MAG: ATP phosphoribosyltransferase [Spirochaetia bacterium]|nr:ATP phosphoribosyltransferase [Spirochaetia bacterium]